MIRGTKLDGSVGEAVRRTRDSTVPPVEGRSGFRGHCAFVTEEGGAAVPVGVPDGRGDAVRSHGRVVRIMRDGLREMACGTPGAAMGETVALAAAQPDGAGRAPPWRRRSASTK